MANKSGKLREWNLVNEEWDYIFPQTLAANIISGVFDIDRIPILDATKVTLTASDVGALADDHDASAVTAAKISN